MNFKACKATVPKQGWDTDVAVLWCWLSSCMIAQYWGFFSPSPCYYPSLGIMHTGECQVECHLVFSMWFVTLNTICVYTRSSASSSKIHKTYSSNSEQPSSGTVRLYSLIHAQPDYHYLQTSLWISIPIWRGFSSAQVLREFGGGMQFWWAWIGLIFGDPNFTTIRVQY
jgi:hypothetical protein